MKKAAYELNDAMMELVNGGDYGDSRYDTEKSNPRYHVGDIVEVYTGEFHIQTERSRVIKVWWSDYWKSWRYEVQYLAINPIYGVGDIYEMDANGIQSA